jgi:hypothetical protein
MLYCQQHHQHVALSVRADVMAAQIMIADLHSVGEA